MKADPERDFTRLGEDFYIGRNPDVGGNARELCDRAYVHLREHLRGPPGRASQRRELTFNR